MAVMFGSTSPFGQSSTSPLGQTSFGSQQQGFGQDANNPFAPKPFGSPTTTFGAQCTPTPTGTPSSSPFGSSTLAFGASPTPAFGATSCTFGSGSVLGQKPSFGAFGSSPSQSSHFGSTIQQTQPSFGSNALGATTPAFGTTPPPPAAVLSFLTPPSMHHAALSVMACTDGEMPPAPMAASSFEAGPSSSRFGVASTPSSFSFPSVRHGSTLRSSLSSPETLTPFHTPPLFLPHPTTPFDIAKPNSPTSARCALSNHSSSDETSFPASSPPSLQDIPPFVLSSPCKAKAKAAKAKAAQENIYTKVEWNYFLSMMAQLNESKKMTRQINLQGTAVVVKQRADDEIDLQALFLNHLRHLCKVNGLKQNQHSGKEILRYKLQEYKEQLLCKAHEAPNLKKNKENQPEYDEELDRVMFDLEQAKCEQAELELELENCDMELQREVIMKRKDEELAEKNNAEVLEIQAKKKRRIAATLTKKAAGHATPRTNTQSKFRSTKKAAVHATPRTNTHSKFRSTKKTAGAQLEPQQHDASMEQLTSQ